MPQITNVIEPTRCIKTRMMQSYYYFDQKRYYKERSTKECGKSVKINNSLKIYLFGCFRIEEKKRSNEQ